MANFFGIYNPSDGINKNNFELLFEGLTTTNKKFQYHEKGFSVGWSEFENNEISYFGVQKSSSKCNQTIVIGFFRLTFRDDLGDKLGLCHDDLLIKTDSELVLLSYLKWKKNCLKHIEGDFSFIIFDKCAKVLLLVRQPCGYSVLYFVEEQDTLYFSDDASLFLRVDIDSIKINWTYLLGLSIKGSVPNSTETVFSGLKLLQNGSYLIWKNHHDKELSLFWEMGDKENIKYKEHIDYFLELRSIVSMAVRARIRSKSNAIFLSSGLDSTAVAYHLINELKFRGESVDTYTNYPFHLDEIDERVLPFVDESPLVKKFVKNFDNVNAYYFDFPDLKPSDFIDCHKNDDPFFPIVLPNTGWINKILEFASQNSISNVFSGQAGNFTFTFTPDYISLESFKRFKLKSVFRSLTILSKSKGISLLLSFRILILSPLKNQFIQLIKKYKFKFLAHRHISPYLNKNFINFKSSKKIENLFFVLGQSHFWSLNQMRKKRLQVLLNFGSQRWHQNVLTNQIICSDPTSDLRLISFCFSIPIEIYFFDSNPKYLYVQSYKDFLPNSIINSAHGKIQAFDFIFRIKGDLKLHTKIRELLEQTNLKDLLEFKTLEQLLINIKDSSLTRMSTSETLYFMQNISLLYFILRNKRHIFD